MRIFQEETFGPAVSVASSTRHMMRLAVTNGTLRRPGKTHPMMLEHYQETKNLMVGYAQQAEGFVKGLRLRMRIAIGDQSRMQKPLSNLILLLRTQSG